jgi:D-3-phosphoglycerate dehydrogenase / 2-oxoglutarate reductase
VLLIRSRTKIDSEILDETTNLKLIITATSGFDHIDFEQTQLKGVTCMYTPLANADSAAELTVMHMLGALRHLSSTQRALRDGRWREAIPTGHELKSQTVALVGLGRVGSRVAKIVKAFGAEVIACDPHQNDETFKSLGVDRMGITEVFAQADILSMHVPLNAETRRMIRAETLEITKEGLIFINTSRGKVVDEGALVAALESGQIAAAGLDVFENEPLARDSRLRKLANVMLTTHMGAYTEEAYKKASMMAVEKCIQFIKAGQISDNLPLQ